MFVIGKFGGLALMVLAATLLIACAALITGAFRIRFLGRLESRVIFHLAI